MKGTRTSLRRPAIKRIASALDPTATGLPPGPSMSAPGRVQLANEAPDAVHGVPYTSSGWPRHEINAFAGHASAGADTQNMLYYWFAPAYMPMPGSPTPLIIWLNGGPGASSLAGMLWENGPFVLDEAGTVTPSSYPWNLAAHMLYWDNPVGTGYSYNLNGDPHCYVRNERELAAQFVTALTDFYTKHPEYADAPLYLAGESYAGKYIPYIALEILYRNLTGVQRPLPLRGTAIGDGWMVPAAQSHDQIDYAAQLGLLDTVQRQRIMTVWEEIEHLVEAGAFAEAKAKDDELMKMISDCGGGEDLYDVRQFGDMDLQPLADYLGSPFVKECFNVPPHVTWECSDESGPVSDALVDDIMQPVDHLVQMLVEFPKSAQDIIEWHDAGSHPISPIQQRADLGIEPVDMLFYTGTFDLSCGFQGTEQMLRGIQWPGDQTWQSLPRSVWTRPGGDGAEITQGYVKHLANLTQIEIPDAGHMIPLSQAAINRDMIYRWITGDGFPGHDPLSDH